MRCSVACKHTLSHKSAAFLAGGAPVSWFSMKVIALEGHMPMRPGGRPCPSTKRQYSPRPIASCRIPVMHAPPLHALQLLVLYGSGAVLTICKQKETHTKYCIAYYSVACCILCAQLCCHKHPSCPEPATPFHAMLKQAVNMQSVRMM